MRHWLALIIPVVAIGCASADSPWPCDPGGRGEARLIKPGMTIEQVQAWKGCALRDASYNPYAKASYCAYGDEYTGTACWPIQGLTNRVAEVTFDKGIATNVRYVPLRWKTLDKSKRAKYVPLPKPETPTPGESVNAPTAERF
jgi:hypothetical protein